MLYPQNGADPIPLDWWECHSCKGWFVHPIPRPDIIARYWSGIDWLILIVKLKSRRPRTHSRTVLYMNYLAG